MHRINLVSGAVDATFDSLAEAARSCSSSGTTYTRSISDCCKQKQTTAYGFGWRYADEPADPEGEARGSIAATVLEDPY